MSKFYFTYGTDPAYPFRGGWTEIEAPDMLTACKLFRAYHPDRPGSAGLLNYADIYSEDRFIQTDMLLNGNFGAWCQEEITVTWELIAREGSKAEALLKG